MRREPWFAVGLILAAVGEVQWAATFYATDDLLRAILIFLAACGLFLAGGGVIFNQGRWAVTWGLALSTLAHVAYAGSTITWGPLLVAAAVLAAVGLGAAAWGAHSSWRVDLLRYGLFGAALGGALWVLSDSMSGDMAFMVGNVFAMFGWGAAAAFTPDALE